MNMNKYLDDAQRVTIGASAPAFRRHDYEEAMLDLAKAESLPGENVNQAFSRLCSNGDKRMDALYAASCVAAPGSTGSTSEAPPAAGKSLAKRMSDRDRLWHIMLKTARHERREGETVQKALDRLLETDQVMRDAYDLYSEGG